MFKRFLFISFLLLISSDAAAGVDRLLGAISAETGVPKWVINSVCTHESQTFHNGKRQPWPWTLNVAGKGYWFNTKQAAINYAELEFSLSSPNASIDVGMCQVNWYWHGQNFDSVSELIDPVNNVRYAANFLKQLKKDNSSWEQAIGAYHSPVDKKRAANYAKAVLSAP